MALVSSQQKLVEVEAFVFTDQYFIFVVLVKRTLYGIRYRILAQSKVIAVFLSKLFLRY